MKPSSATTSSVGELLRAWRQRRHMSQLDLACEAEISTRHMSFMENGRSVPSREMLLRLADQLDVPLRDRNGLLIAAGYAPMYSQRALNDPALQEVRKALDMVLTGHEPYPALAIDRHWQLMSANRMLMPLMTGVASELLEAPINVLRLSMHPGGLAPRIVNIHEWREHLLSRLRHQCDVTGDEKLIGLVQELAAYPVPPHEKTSSTVNVNDYGGVVVPLQLRSEAGVLSLFSTTTVFGTPRDITIAELAIESFFPADAETAQQLRSIARSLGIQ